MIGILALLFFQTAFGKDRLDEDARKHIQALQYERCALMRDYEVLLGTDLGAILNLTYEQSPGKYEESIRTTQAEKKQFFLLRFLFPKREETTPAALEWPEEIKDRQFNYEMFNAMFTDGSERLVRMQLLASELMLDRYLHLVGEIGRVEIELQTFGVKVQPSVEKLPLTGDELEPISNCPVVGGKYHRLLLPPDLPMPEQPVRHTLTLAAGVQPQS